MPEKIAHRQFEHESPTLEKNPLEAYQHAIDKIKNPEQRESALEVAQTEALQTVLHSTDKEERKLGTKLLQQEITANKKLDPEKATEINHAVTEGLDHPEESYQSFIDILNDTKLKQKAALAALETEAIEEIKRLKHASDIRQEQQTKREKTWHYKLKKNAKQFAKDHKMLTALFGSVVAIGTTYGIYKAGARVTRPYRENAQKNRAGLEALKIMKEKAQLHSVEEIKNKTLTTFEGSGLDLNTSIEKLVKDDTKTKKVPTPRKRFLREAIMEDVDTPVYTLNLKKPVGVLLSKILDATYNAKQYNNPYKKQPTITLREAIDIYAVTTVQKQIKE